MKYTNKHLKESHGQLVGSLGRLLLKIENNKKIYKHDIRMTKEILNIAEEIEEGLL